MSVSPSRTATRLPGHVRACLVGDQMIFLDLMRNKYVGVTGSRVHELSDVILGETAVDDPLASPANPAFMDDWIQRLVHQQLLSNMPGSKTQRSPTLPEPMTSLDTDDEEISDQNWRLLLRLWRSTWVTATWLRRCSLANIADRVVALRARHSECDRSLDADAMRTGVATYIRLRPFALTSHDRCLNDSLALIHFLACQGLFPKWVIGVRAAPFCAHSWVQCAGVVLNDVPEHVRDYRPILIV